MRGRAKDDAVLIEVRVTFAYETRGGRICRSRQFPGHEWAVEAARADG